MYVYIYIYIHLPTAGGISKHGNLLQEAGMLSS